MTKPETGIHPVVRILVIAVTTFWLPYCFYGYSLVGSLLQACACGFCVVALRDYMDGNTYGWRVSGDSKRL